MENQEQQRTEISEIGEFGLIEHLTRNVTINSPHTLTGIGDDAAVLDAKGKKILISTDLLIEGVHFDLIYTPLKHLGYKAAVVNFSDMVAMNTFPSQITISLAISNRFSLEALDAFYEGLLLACKHYHVDLIGGDTSSCASGMVISVSVIGYENPENIVYRSGAKENDLICISGDLGAAYAGLLLLEREKEVYKANPEIQPDLDGHDYVLQRQLRPEARVDIIHLLKKSNVLPTSMIDISDGLASEILHICKESGTGAAIYPEKISIDPTTTAVLTEFGIDPITGALNGGEDYELLFTIKPSDYDAVKSIQGISVVGHITEKNVGTNLIMSTGELTPLTAQGWDALRGK